MNGFGNPFGIIRGLEGGGGGWMDRLYPLDCYGCTAGAPAVLKKENISVELSSQRKCYLANMVALEAHFSH